MEQGSKHIVLEASISLEVTQCSKWGEAMKKSSYWLLTIIAGVMLAVILFGQATKSSLAQKWSEQRNELSVEAGSFVFQIENEEPQALQASTFSLSYLSDELLAPDASFSSFSTILSDPEVVVSLEMLTMNCGTITFKLLPNENGQYIGEGIPVMPGTWVATATIPTTSAESPNEASSISFIFEVA